MQCKKSNSTLGALLVTSLLTLFVASPATAADYKTIYKFRNEVGDGRNPMADLTFDAAGNLYGTTVYGGGVSGYGTVFKLTPGPDGRWSEQIVHSFSFAGGTQPEAKLIFDADGTLYGTSYEGGWGGGCEDYGCGTIFQLRAKPGGGWTEHVLHSFTNDGVDGYFPTAGMALDAAGNLYGTTGGGGSDYLHGTVFEMVRKPGGGWRERILHSFTGGTDGGNPYASLVLDAAGNLYGTTTHGGGLGCDYGCGTVFKLSAEPDGSWKEQVIARFHGRRGAMPRAGLIFDTAGNLYGTTGGLYLTDGTVFKLTPNPDGSWTKSTLYAFHGEDGADPMGGLIFDSAGNLYGATSSGGKYNSGVVFRLASQPGGHWRFENLHTFKNGELPFAGLVMDAMGNLYGTTVYGGNGVGLVFRIKP